MPFRLYLIATILLIAAALGSLPAQAGVTRGVSIGSGLKVDIHAPDNKRGGGFLGFGRKRAPVIVYVHGGGWIRGTRAKVYRLPQFANARGWMVVSLDYRPVPRTNIDGQLNDVVKGIKWVQRNIGRYGGDPKRVAIMGHSAGSHLVALVAARQRVKGLRGVIPNDVQAYDMVAYGGMRGSLPHVYAAAFGANPRNWMRWSPVTYVRKGGRFPPHLILHSGGNIYDRRRTLSEGYASELRRHGTWVQVYGGRGYSHGAIMSRIGTKANVTRVVDKFLRRVFR
ncbi:MAG: alpha/beta hydrolase [Pseudomonadota bacterium]